jgi:ABC-type sugar transport system permease subunit
MIPKEVFMVQTPIRTVNRQQRALNQFWAILSFLAVPLLLYTVWVIYPTIRTLLFSFTDWDGLGNPNTANFVGFANFERLFSEEPFRKSIVNNILWILVFITIPTTLGLGLAMVLNTDVKFDRFLKIAYYLPLVLATVVVAVVWAQGVYNPRAGLLNTFLSFFIGERAFEIQWLGDPNLAIWSVIGAAVWRQVGYVMILYLAGLKTVDAEVLEAAKMDGAEGWTLFRYMVFPMLAPVTTIVVVISIIDSLRSFDMVNIMTRGNPFDSSNVLANYMYLSFEDYRMGYAASIAVVLFAISLIFIFFYLREVMRQEEAQ